MKSFFTLIIGALILSGCGSDQSMGASRLGQTEVSRTALQGGPAGDCVMSVEKVSEKTPDQPEEKVTQKKIFSFRTDEQGNWVFSRFEDQAQQWVASPIFNLQCGVQEVAVALIEGQDFSLSIPYSRQKLTDGAALYPVRFLFAHETVEKAHDMVCDKSLIAALMQKCGMKVASNPEKTAPFSF